MKRPYVLGSGWRGNCIVNLCRARNPDAPYPRSVIEEVAAECYRPVFDADGSVFGPTIPHPGPHTSRDGGIWPSISWRADEHAA